MIFAEAIWFLGFVVSVLWIILSLAIGIKLNRVIFFACCIAYTCFVAGVTLFPMPVDGFGTDVPQNLIPFRTIMGTLSNGLTRTALVQLGGNILLSVPYGVAVECIVRKNTMPKRFLFAFLFPLVVESAQLVSGLLCGALYRSFDIDDFFLNMLGAFCGYLLYRILPKAMKNYFDLSACAATQNKR